jgi:uncharacterized protein YbjT (DUF2867 family)
MSILVTGATGNVGGALVNLLAERGEDVRALTRRPERAELPRGVRVVGGDLTDPDSTAAALRDVSKALLVMGADNGRAFAAAAARTGLEQVVLVSSFTTDVAWPSGANLIARRHREGEAALTAAGVPATFLRPAGFQSNVLLWARGIADDRVLRAPFPRVRLPLIHPDDIAAAAAAVLSEDGHVGRAYLLTGPEALSVVDQTAIIARVLGRQVRFDELSKADAEAFLRPSMPVAMIRSLLEVLGPAAAVPVTSNVADLSGRPAKTFEQWAAEHRDLLGPSAIAA